MKHRYITLANTNFQNTDLQLDIDWCDSVQSY